MDMKRRASRRNRSCDLPNHIHPFVTDRRIVPVNDGPLRERAAKDCNKAMAKLEKARAELRRFEQEDRPAFGRWMAAHFGALLTELRESARQIHEHEGVIRDVDIEMIWSGRRNPRKAYAAVMKRRESPDADDDFAEGVAFDPFEEMAGGNPKEECRALFEDFVRSVLGINPEQMGKADCANMFAEFEAAMFGEDAQASPFQSHDVGKPSASRDEPRIKEIYRILVRRLHPDVRADGDAAVSAIWHEVQEAYAARDLDRMETLLALTELKSGANGSKASISQMRVALAEFNRAFRAVRRSLEEAKRDPAWGFSRNPFDGPMKERIRRALEVNLSRQRRVVAELKVIIEGWSRPWRPRVKKPRKQVQVTGETQR